MIHIEKKENCCGCGACSQKCPQHCIRLIEDKEGFLYPHINKDACIDCGVCEKVCPVINPNEEKEPIETLAAQNKNEYLRMKSSSGGIFISLAEYILQQKGAVVGAVFDKEWAVEHRIATNWRDIQRMMGSKYVQSRTGNTFSETEKLLKSGQQVLYTGSPCQIAALKRFLQKEYDNLFTVDFICHGVPSPAVWRDYLKELNGYNDVWAAMGKKSKVSSLCDVRLITNIEFRNKSLLGWEKFCLIIKKHDFKKSNGTNKQNVIIADKHHNNLYMKAFIDNLILRPSCYVCAAKSQKSGSDLTLADFWSVEKVLPQWHNDDKGTSILFVNTPKGSEALKAIESSILIYNVSYSSIKPFNPAITKSVCPHVNRASFFKGYTNGKNSVHQLLIKNCFLPKDRIKLLAKLILKRFKPYHSQA
jgi:NAD-dependent dihydropyrimidine dehydrogenase PreA subunit